MSHIHIRSTPQPTTTLSTTRAPPLSFPIFPRPPQRYDFFLRLPSSSPTPPPIPQLSFFSSQLKTAGPSANNQWLLQLPTCSHNTNLPPFPTPLPTQLFFFFRPFLSFLFYLSLLFYISGCGLFAVHRHHPYRPPVLVPSPPPHTPHLGVSLLGLLGVLLLVVVLSGIHDTFITIPSHNASALCTSSYSKKPQTTYSPPSSCESVNHKVVDL